MKASALVTASVEEPGVSSDVSQVFEDRIGVTMVFVFRQLLRRNPPVVWTAGAFAFLAGLRLAMSRPCADTCFEQEPRGVVCLPICIHTWSPWRIAFGVLIMAAVVAYVFFEVRGARRKAREDGGMDSLTVRDDR